MYFPVLINEASSGYPLVLQLRAGNSHPSKGEAGILRWLFWRLKRAWLGVRIILRADAGFSFPEILRVGASKHNSSNLQTRHFQTRIICN
jgi:hypothetical protein